MGTSPEERRKALEEKMRQRKEALGQRIAGRRARLDDRLGKAPTPTPREAASPPERPPAAPAYPGTAGSQPLAGHRPEVHLPGASRVPTPRAPRVPLGPPEVQRGLRIAAMLLLIAGLMGAGVLLQRYVLTPDSTHLGEDTLPVPIPLPDLAPAPVPVPEEEDGEEAPEGPSSPLPGEEELPDPSDLEVAEQFNFVNRTANSAFSVSEVGLVLPPIREVSSPEEFGTYLVAHHPAPAEVGLWMLQRYTSDPWVQESLVAVYLPDEGVIVRSWGVEALSFRELVAFVVREQWGHGLLAQYSGIGIERRKLRLDYVPLRDFMEGPVPSSAGESTLEEASLLVSSVSSLAYVGYCAWIERHMLDRMRAGGILEEGGYAVPSVETIVAQMEEAGLRASLDAFVSVMEVRPGAGPEEVHARMLALQEALWGEGDQFKGLFGLPASYLLGYHLYDAFARRWGEETVPMGAITALACQYNLDKTPLEDLATFVQEDYRLNPDSRLAMLALSIEPDSMLATRRYTGRQMKEFFVNTLKAKTSLAIPEALR